MPLGGHRSAATEWEEVHLCNAWNHDASCTCGFGGEGHRGDGNIGGWGGPRMRLGASANVLPTHAIARQFTVQSAGTGGWSTEVREPCTVPTSCPCCGAAVYFHTNGYGDAVFFDELGPPWPKHPCLDEDGQVRHTLSSRSEPAAATTRWADLGMGDATEGRALGVITRATSIASGLIAQATGKRLSWPRSLKVTLMGSGGDHGIVIILPSDGDAEACVGRMLDARLEACTALGKTVPGATWFRFLAPPTETSTPPACKRCDRKALVWTAGVGVCTVCGPVSRRP